MISDFQTNTIYFSKWLLKNHKDVANQITQILEKQGIKYHWLENTADYWARDYMSIQVNEQKFVQYVYQPDYLKGKKDYITNPDEVLKSLEIPTIKTNIVLDGGNVVKSANAVVLTDKIFLENKHLYSESVLISELEKLFETDRIVIIPWDKDDECGHTDGMLRFIDNDTVLLQGFYNEYPKAFQKKLFKALQEKGIRYEKLSYNVKKRSEHNWAYINFLQTHDIMLIPRLNIDEDEQALSQLQQYYPQYRNKMFFIDVSSYIKDWGGALNCLSWTIKK
jgi:agmatine deiminase